MLCHVSFPIPQDCRHLLMAGKSHEGVDMVRHGEKKPAVKPTGNMIVLDGT
jgi:hypothetical protein